MQLVPQGSTYGKPTELQGKVLKYFGAKDMFQTLTKDQFSIQSSRKHM